MLWCQKGTESQEWPKKCLTRVCRIIKQAFFHRWNAPKKRFNLKRWIFLLTTCFVHALPVLYVSKIMPVNYFKNKNGFIMHHWFHVSALFFLQLWELYKENICFHAECKRMWFRPQAVTKRNLFTLIMISTQSVKFTPPQLIRFTVHLRFLLHLKIHYTWEDVHLKRTEEDIY